MPAIFRKNSTGWIEILSVFRKNSTGWVEILNAYRKNSTGWIKVFAKNLIPGIIVTPKVRNSSGQDINNTTVIARVGDTLTGYRGSWSNSPTIYEDRWYFNQFTGGGSYGPFSPAQTNSTLATTLAMNGYYIVYQVRATNASGSSDYVTSSNEARIVKYVPEATGNYTLTGSAIVGSTLQAFESISPATWKQTTNLSGDTYPDSFEYEWSYENGTPIQSLAFNAINSSSYLVKSADLGNKIRLRVKGVNTGGEAYTLYLLTATVSASYQFSFGNVLYVGTNAYIGLDAGANFPTVLPPGRTVAIHPKDMVQYRLAEYSNSTDYWLYYRSYLYNQPQTAANALDYQIRFYTDTSKKYCDVYYLRKGSNVVLPTFDAGFWNSGIFGGIFPSPPAIGTGTVLRVYFDCQQATYGGISWTTISDNVWKDISTAILDDDSIQVTTGPNRQAEVPVNTVLPTLTTNTGNFSAGSIITINPGSWNNASSYAYELLYGSSTPISTDSTATKTLVNTNEYTITFSDATASSYYFRGRVTAYAGASQTGNSTIALSTTSPRSTITPSTSISVGTATSSGFTISGTASPVSGGIAYVSISEIQIWNSSQTSQVATITTGLPGVNNTTGAWSYVWSGEGSPSTTYYAKAKAKSPDSDQTTITTGFSSSITTSAGVSTPTALTATNDNGSIKLAFSGGTGSQYDIFFNNVSTRPTDGQEFADYPNVTSPYYPALSARNVERWFWVRKSTGTLRSNWYPSDSSVSIRLPLFAPPSFTITNSAQTSNSLSWHWNQPTPSATQDQPTSWDWALTQSTSTPSNWPNNVTTRPTAASPLVTSSLSASTTYYLHVRAKNADNSTTNYQSGATTSGVILPGNPSSPDVGSSTINRSLSTSLTRNSNTNKTQYWSGSTSASFQISWTAGSNATSHEVFWNTSGNAPTASTNADYAGLSTSKTESWSYGSSLITYYYWVRARNNNGVSEWVYIGSKNIPAFSATSFSIRIYRGNGSSSTPPSPQPAWGTGTYTWSGLTNRGNPAANPPGEGHYAWVQVTLNGGTALTATSSTV